MNINQNVLYCFVSHQPVVINDTIRISDMMRQINYDHYIIVYGGQRTLNIDNNHVIYLECPDDYCSLPEKINKLIKFSVDNYEFDFLAKFDRTIEIKKIYDTTNLKDYSGGLIKNYVSCGWHFNKCPNNLRWNRTEFKCDPSLRYVLGLGYVLSKKAIRYIYEDAVIFNDHVYEDVYIGSIMHKNNILPSKLENMKDYFFDKEHAF